MSEITIKSKVTIQDLIDIIHFTIINKFGKNDICVEHTNAIYCLTHKNKILYDIEVNETFKRYFSENNNE